jgi:glycosyltransferase involved in cell wall biosynthesis
MKNHLHNLNKKSVLFISHDASHTGAPIFLLNFIRWFKENTSIPFIILLGDGGPLTPDFKSLGSVFFFKRTDVLPNYPSISKNYYFDAVLTSIHLRSLIKKIRQNNIGLIYSNTITNGNILDTLSSLHCSVVTHAHEMEYLIRLFGEKNFQLIKTHTNKYVAVSKAVKDNLMENHHLSSDDIEVIHGSIPLHKMDHRLDRAECKRSITSELSIPEDSFLIGAVGNFHWLKGSDLFVQLAKELSTMKTDTSIHFIWIGGENSGLRFQELMHDVERLGIHKNIHFIEHKQNPLKYLSSFDIFTLVSREDSFPLACLEAASVGTPILCFDNAGGAKEFVQDDCGFIIPYLDLHTMAKKLIELIGSSSLRNKMADRAAQKVREHFDFNTSAIRVFNEIKRYI